MEERYTFDVIGVVHSCYREKFGIPRQPGLVSAATATLELLTPYNRVEAVKGLEGFSHIWVSFIFHAVESGKWSPMVRPPRLGGNEKVGVFASRSTHRPNPLGLSVVELAGIEANEKGVILHLIGADLLEGTPVIDIKPYIPYVDSLPDAIGGFATSVPGRRLEVIFSEQADETLVSYEESCPQLRRLISESLAYDPRPAYRVNDEGGFRGGVHFYEFDVRFEIIRDVLRVTEIVPEA
ncbi:MAG: tRNA (N6-threonylcarbamoyladenosine(37)-N6)-methyltransferase TrmO [Chromatiales bacterium]|nr:tRNA (N6-threonylcarbamoyladenosine(37)-N6)-methyltransferase TrmO [Chromatiales bacterium]